MLEETGALLKGHFELTSGLHSDRYVQCAQAFKYPQSAERLGSALARRFADKQITLVAGPAIGGIILAHEVARAFKVPCIFSERQDGRMALRRGFHAEPQDKVLLVEDVVTTGGSILELAELISSAGAAVVGIGCVVDRRGDKSKLPAESQALLKLPLATYQKASCPLCQQGSPAVKPGSRLVTS